ncbi:MAG: glycosyltransferase, partial [Erythrobacter sp.]|nr:glycosyltransferase [Erythrobacter sp.]
PDAKYIAEKLEWLILNPEKITEISKHARAFVEKEHLYTTIAVRRPMPLQRCDRPSSER